MSPRLLVYTPQAEDDLADLAAYWIDAAPDRARDFLVRFRAALEHHADAGLAGHPADHIHPGCRVCYFGTYVAVVSATPEFVRVLRIFHAARNIRDLLQDGPGS